MTSTAAQLLRREVIPFYLSLLVLLAVTLVIDGLLHLAHLVWVGRYLGIPGVLLIIGSFGYSLRRRRLISAGRPAALLRVHEYMAWAGSLLILVHAGIHFNAILGWLAIAAMIVNVASGLTGKFLLERSRRRLDASRRRMLQRGMSVTDVTERLHQDAMTFDVVKNWRVVHIPIALAFGVLAIAHILSELLFWSWS
jgi:hypothetical protein